MPTTTTGLATSFITFSRPGASGGGATVTDADGKIKWAGHNLLTNSESFDASAWVKDNSGAVNPAVTANAGVSPDGRSTADRIVFDRTGGTFSRVQQTAAAAIGANHTFSVWMRTFSGGTANVGLRLDTTGINCVVTGTWTRFEVSAVGPAGAALGCQILLFSSIAGNDVTADVLVWGAHLYRSDLGGMQLNPAMPAGMQSYYPTTVRNLLGYTEDFANAYWTKAGLLAFGSGSTSNAGIAPNGLQTADLLVEDTAAGAHNIYRSFTCISGTPYTWAAYVKPAGRSIVRLVNQATAVVYDVEFSLSGAGSATNRSGSGTATITALSDGWYRISATATATAGGTGYWQLNLCSAANTPSYTGDGVSGIYLWGAQLSDSASLDTYVPQYGAAVTSAAYYAPRLDYDPVTLAARGLLVEEQRSNIALQSNAFNDAAWTKGGLAATPVIADTVVSPSGATDADKLVEGTTTSSHGVFNTSGYTTTSGQNVVFSVFAKAAERNILIVDAYFGSSAFTYFNLSTGTIGTNAAGNTASIQSVGNGWYRCTVVRTSTNSTANSTFIGLYMTSTDNVNVYAGDGTSGLYVWGAQVESNAAFPTSLIPTGASTATRTADVASVSTQAFPYSDANGSIVVSGVRFGGAGYGPLVVPRNTATTLNDRNPDMSLGAGANGAAGGVSRVDVVRNGSVIAPLGTTTGTYSDNTNYKVGYAYATSDFVTVVNGGTANTQASGGAPPSGINQVDIGHRNSGAFLNGWIRQITMIPRRLSNAELASRTAA